MGTKSYYIGPQDGWTQIVSGADTALDLLRVSAVPHTKPFQIFGGSTPPTAADIGVTVCHKPFFINVAGNADVFYIRVVDAYSGSRAADGRMRLDVYAQGGVLS